MADAIQVPPAVQPTAPVETIDFINVVPADFQVVGGLFDSLLQGLLSSFKPNIRNINHELLKDGVSRVIDSLKPMIPGSLDDMLFDSAKLAMHTIIDSWKNAPAIVVGAVGPDGKPQKSEALASAFKESVMQRSRKRTQKEVEELIISEGGDPKKFAPWILLLLQFLPTALELIQKLLGK